MRPLGSGPDRDPAINIKSGQTAMRFQITLMNFLGPEGIVKDVIGLAKSLLHIPLRDSAMIGHVTLHALSSHLIGHLVISQLLMNDGRPRLHGLFRVEDRWQ